MSAEERGTSITEELDDAFQWSHGQNSVSRQWVEGLLERAAQNAADQARTVSAVEGDSLVRDILESLCRRDGISLDSTVVPGEPARNFELADRLGIGYVFGLHEKEETA